MTRRSALATRPQHDVFDPTLCETWSLIAPGEPCPTCADQNDEEVAKAEAEARFRASRRTLDVGR